MTDHEKQSPLFDDDCFHDSAPRNPAASAEKKSDKPKTRSAKTPKAPGTAKAGKALQPFLPGLSRRGRPRSPNPVPPSVRALESRRRRMETGAKRIELLLEPAVADQLEALVEHFRTSRTEIIARLVTQAAKRIPRKG